MRRLLLTLPLLLGVAALGSTAAARTSGALMGPHAETAATLAADDDAPVPDSSSSTESHDDPPAAVSSPDSSAGPSAASTAADLFTSATATPLGMEVIGFRQRKPRDGDPVTEPTRAYVSYDEDNLYVVFICEDDPRLIRARVVPRDKITDDDRVMVYLDTFHDGHRAYAFEVNPLGIQRDGMLAEGQSDDFTYDALWYSEGRMTESGYVVRIRIPFSSLRFSEQSVQTWGIGFGRTIERKAEKSYWPYITDRIEGFVNQLGTAQGLKSISAGRRLQIVPYGVVADDRFLDKNFDIAAFRRTRQQRYGADVKAVVKDAVTMDIAVKPDFSQVEPDEPQVTANKRFEVKFPEKRPFFIENASYFQTPVELFFTRRLAEPSGGGRLTSKQGPWVIGGLFMDDQGPGRVPFGDPLHGERAYAGVIRIQCDLPGQSTLGLFTSDRELAGNFNRVYAADTRLKLGTTWVVTGQIAQAETRLPPAAGDTLSLRGPQVWGNAGDYKIRRAGRHFDWSAEYQQFSPAFQAQLGFIKRVGIRQAGTSVDYTFRPRKSLVTAWGPKLSGQAIWGWDGQLQDASAEFSSIIELPADTQFEVGWEQSFELYKGVEYQPNKYHVLAESNWLPWLAFSIAHEGGTSVNHKPPKKTSPFLANAGETDVSVSLRPTSRIEFKESVTYGWLRRAGSDSTGPYDRPVYTNWILQSKLKYQVTRGLSIRAIANYEGLVPNPLLSGEKEARLMLPDVLVTFTVNPWTALHAGYTERFENVLLQSGVVVPEPRSTDAIRLPTTSVDRQYFIKLSYLLRM